VGGNVAMADRYKIGDIIFGNWRLTRLIGEGGYGHVFEAERNDLGRTQKSAIKIVTTPRNQSEINSVLADGMDENSITAYFKEFVEELAREISLMSSLRGNSNIVSYEDHAVIQHTDGIGWDILIRMELLTPLNDYIDDFQTNKDVKNTSIIRLSRKDIVQLGIDICGALELCQKFNIVHRDVKPENIFFSNTSGFKLGDFGIARTIEKTAGGLSKKGSYNYVAPEVYRGEKYNSNVDIYSLGLVLYRLLNDKRLPFLPEYPNPISYSDQETARDKRLGGAQLPPPKNADRRLAEIVLKACAYNPAYRYHSPKYLREDLEKVLHYSEYDMLDKTVSILEQKKVEYRAPITPPNFNVVDIHERKASKKQQLPWRIRMLLKVWYPPRKKQIRPWKMKSWYAARKWQLALAAFAVVLLLVAIFNPSNISLRNITSSTPAAAQPSQIPDYHPENNYGPAANQPQLIQAPEYPSEDSNEDILEPPEPIYEEPPVTPTVIQFFLDSNTYTIDGESHDGYADPIIRSGIAMLPLRTVANIMNANTTWVPETQTVFLAANDTIIEVLVGRPLPHDIGDPVFVGDSVFVSFRHAAEIMGATLYGSGAEGAIHLYLGYTQEDRAKLCFTIGSYMYVYNGEVYELDAAIFLDPVTYRMMVPLRITAEAMGAIVEWDSVRQLPVIVSGQLRLPVIANMSLPDETGTPVIVNGVTFVPLPHLTKLLSAKAIFDSTAQTVSVVVHTERDIN